MMLPGGDVVRLAHESKTHGAGCRLDIQQLADLSKRLSMALDDGADLVIINRFGRSEVEDGGLVDLIAQALDADVPVLIAVPEQRFPAWIKFSDGMNVRLACRREAIDRWWQSVGGVAMRRRPNRVDTFCEVAK